MDTVIRLRSWIRWAREDPEPLPNPPLIRQSPPHSLPPAYLFFWLLPGPLSLPSFVWGCLSSDTRGRRSLVHGSPSSSLSPMHCHCDSPLTRLPVTRRRHSRHSRRTLAMQKLRSQADASFHRRRAAPHPLPHLLESHAAEEEPTDGVWTQGTGAADINSCARFDNNNKSGACETLWWD